MNNTPNVNTYHATTNVNWAGRYIADYIKEGLINDNDYAHQFAFRNLPTNLEDPAALDMTSKPANLQVGVLPAAIGKQFDYDLMYVYKNISLTKNEDGSFNSDHDYALKVWSKKTTFKNPLDLYTFGFGDYLKNLTINWNSTVKSL